MRREAHRDSWERLRRRIDRPYRVAGYDFLLLGALLNRQAGNRLLNLLRKPFTPLLRYLFLFHYVRRIKRLLAAENPDRVMVVNGGYPAGDANRAATIAWGALRGTRPKALHNVHNFCVPPRWWERPLEALADAGLSTAGLKAEDLKCSTWLGLFLGFGLALPFWSAAELSKHRSAAIARTANDTRAVLPRVLIFFSLKL